MENPNESIRLDTKTDPESVRRRAHWCGVRPGMRILDVGCGSGKTASLLYEMVQPAGQVVGIDLSADRIGYACKNFGNRDGLEFQVRDFTGSLKDLGRFDIIWVQFVLEYFRKEADAIVENLTASLKRDGHLCLLDLDHNCMNHHPLTETMHGLINDIIRKLESGHNFDPFAGRKLHAHLYDHQYRNIQVTIMPHGLVYGDLLPRDQLNWHLKMAVVSQKAKGLFSNYPGGMDAAVADFSKFFEDPRRFSYNLLIMAKGKKPVHGDVENAISA